MNDKSFKLLKGKLKNGTDEEKKLIANAVLIELIRRRPISLAMCGMIMALIEENKK